MIPQYQYRGWVLIIAVGCLMLVSVRPVSAANVDVFFTGGQSNAVLSPWATSIESTLVNSGHYNNVRIVHARHSGESIANWVFEDGSGGYSKQSNYLNDFFNPAGTGQIQQTLADIIANGDTPVFRGFFWFQGESDTDYAGEINAYRSRYLGMLDLLQTDLGLGEQIDFAMATIDYGINNNLTASHQAQVNELRAIQTQIGDDFSNGVAVDSRPFSRRDTWHLETDQYQPYGELMANTFIANTITEVYPKVFTDSFAVNNAGGDTARDPGDPLAGTTTEVGGGTWATSSNILLGQVGATTDGNVFATSDTSTSLFAALPVSMNPGDIITLEARIKSFNANGIDNWLGIGFADAEGSLLANATTWAIIRQDTERADEIVMLGAAGGTGADNKLISAATPGLPDADGYTVVQMTYDSGANTVSLDVNGQTLLSDVANLGASPPVITHVAFQPFRNTVEGAIDDWQVTVTQVIPALVGDLDGDGFVGITDLNIVLGSWNQSVPPGNPLADPSGDGFIGIEDLNVVLGNWNAGTPPSEATVPEPGSLALLTLTGLTLVGRSRGQR